MLETVQQAVKPHDRFQVEVKLDYELSQDAAKTHYQIITYFFIPPSLGVNKHTYQKDDFYRDVQNYIRLKTPVLNLAEFSSHSQGPLYKLSLLIQEESWGQDPALIEKILTQLKLMSAMLKSTIRDHLLLLYQRIEEAPDHAKLSLLIDNLIEQYLTAATEVANEFRALFSNFNLPAVEPTLFAAYQLADESVSLLFEEGAVELFGIVQQNLKKQRRTHFQEQLEAMAAREVKHRRQHGYASIIDPDSDNEMFAFRASALKKHAASVLHLKTDLNVEGRGLEHFYYAIAAGVAMTVATALAFYFQTLFGNLTFPFFVALVIGYMFKDRIKDIFRQLLTTSLANRLYDRRITIRTQDGKHQLGVLREKITFVREKDIPKPVVNARNKDTFVNVNNDGAEEIIICYTKDIVLYADAFERLMIDLPPITGLNDIIRFDMRAYLTKMGEPDQSRQYISDGALLTAICHKIYHVNLVTRYRTLKPTREKLHRRLRLVLDQTGIKRIDEIVV